MQDDNNRDKHYADDLVNRYEQMLASNASYYFDVDQFEEIIEYYCDASKFYKALEVIEYAYTLFPDNTTIMLRETQILAGMGHLTRALNRLKSLEKFEPKNEEVLLTMASIYSQLREHPKAIQLFKKVLELGGDEYADEIYLEIALEYENMERFDKAIETLLEALAMKPDNEILLYELAYCYEATDRIAESVEFYQKFIDQYPYNFAAWYNLGNALQKLEQLEDALDAYDYCIAVQSDFAPAYYNKAHALFKLERYNEAIQILEESYAVEQPQAPVYCHIGECFEKLGELDKALFYYRKSLQTDEGYADAYLGIGVVMDLQSKTIDSLSYIEKAIELEPENADYYLFQVEMLKKLKRIDEAEAITESLMTRFADNEDVWLDHSDVLFLKSDMLGAIKIINEGWQKVPQSTALGYRKVAYLLEAGLVADGQELLMRMYMNDKEGIQELVEYYPNIKNNLFYIDMLAGKSN